jgi:hypothetical protein
MELYKSLFEFNIVYVGLLDTIIVDVLFIILYNIKEVR